MNPKPTPVTVTAIDPFATLTADIQGKKAGSITVVGYLGIVVGGLFLFGAGIALTQAVDGGAGAFVLALSGVGFMVASYLWARR